MPDKNGDRLVFLDLYPVSEARTPDCCLSPASRRDFTRSIAALNARAVPQGAFPNEAVSLREDELGHFIRLEVANWPVARPPAVIGALGPQHVDTMLVRVRGPRVQRVGFGRWIRTRARSAGISGWVRNREDYLEALLQGNEKAVQGLISLIEVGPRTAQVDSVEAAVVERKPVRGFSIRRDSQVWQPDGPVMQDGHPVEGEFPTIGHVLGEIDTAQYEYDGDLTTPFYGFETRSGVRSRGRFLIVVDGNWPRATLRRHTGKDGPSVNERIRRAKGLGAAGFILPRSVFRGEVPASLRGENVLLVEDTHDFALRLMKAVRSITPAFRLASVTGSAGKSTTQQMMAHALRSLDGARVLAPGSNRNLYEQSLVELSHISAYDYCALEVASHSLALQHARGVSFSADVAVVTQISESHMELAAGLEEIALVKSEIFEDPPLGGVAIINAEAPYADVLVREAFKAGRQVVTYGESPSSAIRLVSYDPDTRRVTARVGRTTYEYVVGVHGKHNALNSLAVLGMLRAYRIDHIEKALDSLAHFVPVTGRGNSLNLEIRPGSSVTLLNEAYNANPASVRATIAAFATRPGIDTRRVALLGDILELGDASPSIHATLAPDVQAAGLDLVLLFGEQMQALSKALDDLGVEHVYRRDLDEMVSELPLLLRDGDHVLAKASHGTGLADWLGAQAKRESSTR